MPLSLEELDDLKKISAEGGYKAKRDDGQGIMPAAQASFDDPSSILDDFVNIRSQERQTAGEEQGYLETIGKGVVRGAQGIASGVGSIGHWAGEATGVEPLAKAGKWTSEYFDKAAREGWAAPDPYVFRGSFMDRPSLKRAAGIVSEALPSLAAALATGTVAAGGLRVAGMAAGAAQKAGAAAGAFGLGALEGAPQYEEARKAGKSIGEASVFGAASTIGTGILEFLPISRMLKPMAKGGVGKYAMRFLEHAGEEGAQEGAQQVLQNGIARYGYDATRDLTEGLAEAIIGGMGAGAIAGTTSSRINRWIEDRRKEGVPDDQISNDIDQIGNALADDMERHADNVTQAPVTDEITRGADAMLQQAEMTEADPEDIIMGRQVAPEDIPPGVRTFIPGMAPMSAGQEVVPQSKTDEILADLQTIQRGEEPVAAPAAEPQAPMQPIEPQPQAQDLQMGQPAPVEPVAAAPQAPEALETPPPAAPEAQQQAAAPAPTPVVAPAEKAPVTRPAGVDIMQEEYIKGRIKQLGSLDAVKKAYSGDSTVEKYARAVAEERFSKPQAAPANAPESAKTATTSAPQATAPEKSGKFTGTPGWAFLDDKQRPITAAREITKGRNKGKFLVTFGNEKTANGNPRERMIPADAIRQMPVAGPAPVAAPTPTQVQAPPAAQSAPSTEIKRGEIGGKLSAGEIVTTTSGRQTTPFPKYQTAKGDTTARHQRVVDRWLLKNAVDEARARDDDFNAPIFERTANYGTISQADKDSAEQYLFGEQPKVIPPITKTLTPAPAPQESVTLTTRQRDLENAQQMLAKNPTSAALHVLVEQKKKALEAVQPAPEATPETATLAEREKTARPAWNNATTEQREAIAKQAGWATPKGNLTPKGKAIAKSSWEKLSPAAQRIVSKLMPGEATGEQKAAEKEPWEMTRDEYAAAHEATKMPYGKWRVQFPKNAKDKDSIEFTTDKTDNPVDFVMSKYNFHKDVIQQALRKGKPVPAEVLADYPDLTAAQAETKLMPGGVSEVGKVEGVPINEAGTLPEKEFKDLKKKYTGGFVEGETTKPAKPAKESKITTLRGRILKMGKINFGNFKGELRESGKGVNLLNKKDGQHFDLAEQTLRDEGWLGQNENLVDVLRDPENLRRNKVAGEGVEKREQDKTEQEKQFEREMNYEAEEPPPGDYIMLDAEDLPEGKKLTIIDDSATGWDVYTVEEKDPFSVVLKDGRTIELKPDQQVQVRKEDLPEKAQRKSEETKPFETPAPKNEKPDFTRTINWLGSDIEVPYFVLNKEIDLHPNAKNSKIIKSKIKNIGNKTYRFAIVENEDGGRYVNVEVNEDQDGSPSRVITRFRRLSDDEVEIVKKVSEESLKYFKQSPKEQKDLFAKPEKTEDTRPTLTLQGERQMPKAQAEMRTKGKSQRGAEQGGLEFGAPETPEVLTLVGEKVGAKEALSAKKIMGEAAKAGEKSITIPAESEFVASDEILKWERDHYVKDGGTVESSRKKPMQPYPWKEGAWKIDKHFGPYGRMVEQIRRVKLSDLALSEEDYTKVNFEGRGFDAEQYAQWMKEGKTPPPVLVVETDTGGLLTSDGHRRVAAAKLAGADSIFAWVSPRMDTGKKDSAGKPIYTAATYEGLKFGAKRAQDLYDERQAEQMKKADAKETKPGELTDLGTKLGGARKDLQASISREISDDEIATKSLSEVWPKSEVDAIEDLNLAAVAHAVRSEIPSKPRKWYKVTRWVEQVKTVRGLMKFAQEQGVDEVLKKMDAGGDALKNFASKIRLLQKIEREQWDRVGGVSYHPKAYRYEDGKQVASPYAIAEIDNRTVDAKSFEDLITAVQGKLSVEQAGSSMQFEIRSKRDGSQTFINKKGDPLYRPLKTFKDVDEARAFMRTGRSDLMKAWEDLKERENVKETDVRREENRPRTGKDHREGKDATPEMFMDAFGFRGVEFGNWVSQGKNAKERQGILNQAYDALMDLSDILGVPSKALSLNGSLGLGLGSRGHGWASAHFEPNTLVINLTKTRGAGALAHELFHAIDNFFQLKRGKLSNVGRENNYITYQPETYYEDTKTGHRLSGARFNEIKSKNGLNVPEDWKRIEGVRPEVEEAFADLVKALDESPMNKRAKLIDKGKSGGYWSRVIERAARAFENYIIFKMNQQGYQNDYLANVVSANEFSRDAGRYPYLLDEEVKPIAEAFDNLFATIQTKETDKGVTLLRAGERQTDTPEFKKWFGDSKVVDKNGNPLVVYHGTRTRIDFNEFGEYSHFGTTVPANTMATNGGSYGPGRVYPVYLSIKNPKRVKDQAKYKAGTWEDAIVEAESEGYDGLVYENIAEGEGSESWVAFRSDQVKSVFNQGTFDPKNPDIRFSMGATPSPTKQSVERIQQLVPVVEKAMRTSGLPQEVIDRVRVELKPIIDIQDKEADESLAQWAREGKTYETILGATTMRKWSALMELSLQQDLNSLEKTTYHEAFHIAAEWMLPAGDYERLMLHYRTEEGAAEAFADFVSRRSGGQPAPVGVVRRAFLKLRNILESIGNFLIGKGITRPDEIFGKIAGGEYAPHFGRGQGNTALKSEERAPVWYSQMEKFLAAKLPGSGTAKSFMAPIESWAKKGEFKAEELEWSGLKEWLGEQSGKLTKQQVIDYLAANNVRVQEVVKTEQGSADHDKIMRSITKLEDRGYWINYSDTMDGVAIPDEVVVPKEYGGGTISLGQLSESTSELTDLVETKGMPDEDADIIYKLSQADFYNEEPELVVHSAYQLPGASENYRELLLTLPEKSPNFKVVRHPNRPEGFAVQLPDGSYRSSKQDGTPIYYSKMTDAVSYQDAYGIKFHSTHYQEPNILAHIRFNERVDADGKRVLFIEEVQSDFGQKYRKAKEDIADYVDKNFRGLVRSMKIAGVLEEICD